MRTIHVRCLLAAGLLGFVLPAVFVCLTANGWTGR